MYVPAPGMRAPPDAKFRPTLRATSMSDVGGPSRAPTSISTARAAASPMASRLNGRVTAQQSALSSRSHENVPPSRPRIKHEEGALDSTIHVLHEQRPHPFLSTDGSPGIQHGLPAKPSVTFGSRMSIAVPPSPTSSAMSVRTSVTPLHPEPYQSVSGPGRERTAPGGHVSALSMRERELAQALAERGAHSHASSSATAIEEQNTMESEIACTSTATVSLARWLTCIRSPSLPGSRGNAGAPRCRACPQAGATPARECGGDFRRHTSPMHCTVRCSFPCRSICRDIAPHWRTCLCQNDGDQLICTRIAGSRSRSG